MSKLHVNSRLIFLLCIVGFFAQIATHYSGIKSLCIFYNVYAPIEYTIIFFFFKTSFFSKKGRKIFYFSAAVGFAMALYFLLVIGITQRFLSEWVCFNNIIYTAWSLLLLLEIYEDDSIYLDQKMPLSWYLVGIFFFTSCTILIFCFWDYLMTNRNKSMLFAVYGLFNIFMYIAFSIGLLLDVSDNTMTKNKK
ncbi:MAG TPA: hypothetical protein VNX01_11965 [Bacteroidia bacterium]|nr:hypothetical protein [Bacteroidia bacterium]